MSEFLKSFQASAELSETEAADQWAGFSRDLSDRERAETEDGGAESGAQMGRMFLAMHSATEVAQ